MNVGVDVLYWMDECLLNKAPHNDVLGGKKEEKKKDIEMEKQAKANKRKNPKKPKNTANSRRLPCPNSAGVSMQAQR